MPAEVGRAVSEGLVRCVPHVTDAELAWLYAGADLFVYLALDEKGFGLPPVEALHFGTPVVVSDIAVFHENLGSLASYVNPHDVTAIAATPRGHFHRAGRRLGSAGELDRVRAARLRSAIERSRG